MSYRKLEQTFIARAVRRVAADATPHGTPQLSITCDRSDGADGTVVHMPSHRAALRHALPVVVEAIAAPAALFYLALVFTNFRGALVVALAWSYGAVVRQLWRGGRVSTVLLLGTMLLTGRTAVSFVTGSSFLYFFLPLLSTSLVAGALVVSALVRRPVTLRFARDICPLDAELLRQSCVQQFFVRVSLLWGVVLFANSALTAWLLLSSSLRDFVVERTAISWALTAGALFLSVYGFVVTMRRGGYTVRWGKRSAPAQVAQA